MNSVAVRNVLNTEILQHHQQKQLKKKQQNKILNLRKRALFGIYFTYLTSF